MGLVGWAEVANSEESNASFNNGIYETAAAEEKTDISEYPLQIEQAIDEYTDKTGELAEQNFEIETVETDATANDRQENANVESTSFDSVLRNSLQDELFEIIGQLKLRDNAPKNLCDISKLELHEVKFVLDHAARTELLDYYKLARAIHKVKHRLLDIETTPDSIESPNLDELIEYIEKQYQISMDD